MPATTFTFRVKPNVKRRLQKLARSTGRSQSSLVVEALNAYLNVNDWQIAGIKRAISSLDRGEGVAHNEAQDMIKSRVCAS
jgi:RHH-type transcriptional regulator, rel operon repressor / antitoxin RelB